MEYCSKGTTLAMSETQSGTFQKLYGMSSIPDMGGDREKIDITNLEDSNKRYIYGVSDFGELSFEFFYNKEETADAQNAEKLLNAYSALKACQTAAKKMWWKLTYPDGTGHIWKGEPSVKRKGVGVNEALSFTLTISLENDIEDFEPSSDNTEQGT